MRSAKLRRTTPPPNSILSKRSKIPPCPGRILPISLIPHLRFIALSNKLLKRWLPYKLAPAVSPNKTVIGGVGGLIGGMAGGGVAYYIHFGLSKVLDIGLVYGGTLPAVVAFLLIGLVTSVFGTLNITFINALYAYYG